ncbi:MAG: hypothetical protein EAX96_14500 [Candidatus Lokiarchaeota archaeon]|nr:hypothetical protein [Candidatus Lokiarchaeota archaeon]
MIHGILIMNKAGIPIYRDFWIEQLKELIGSESTVLVAGFLNALSMFANQFHWEPSKIHFRDNKYRLDNFEIMFHEEGPFVTVIFLDTYHFRGQVQSKINLIFDEVLVKYLKKMLSEQLVELSFEDKKLIREVFVNYNEKSMIMEHIKQLNKFGFDFVSNPDIKGIFILSLDGELLWNKQLKKEEIEYLLEKVQAAELGAFKEGSLFNMTLDKMGDPVIISETRSDQVPFIYGLVCDINSSLGPIAAELDKNLNKIFINSKK